MLTSQNQLLLSELKVSKPISAKRLAFYRRRFQNRIHSLVLHTFKEQEEKTGLTQKELADRTGHRPENINRWLSIAGNWELNTVSDLLLGMLVDLDDPSVTPIAELLEEPEETTEEPEQIAAPLPEPLEVHTNEPPPTMDDFQKIIRRGSWDPFQSIMDLNRPFPQLPPPPNPGMGAGATWKSQP